jgi:hypothetical protein
MDVLKTAVREAREGMDSSIFSAGMRDVVKRFFEQVRANLLMSGQKTDEITEMMTVMYRKFSTEHGMALSTPMPFSLKKYLDELSLIEHVYQKQFGAAALMTTPQVVIMQKFFDSIASRVKQSFLIANRDVEAWLKVVMAPLESQIKEHKAQLKRRKQSLERIHSAAEGLEEKLAALEQMQADMDRQKKSLSALENELMQVIHSDSAPLKAAA